MTDLNLIKPKYVQNIINKFCVSIGMIPTSYKEALTYEKQILAIGNYLENVVYPAINNNAEALAELQNLFIELKDYVDNYFDNLDVQEEINNKLDEMAEGGELADIIAQYLNTNAIFAYNTIAIMRQATIQNGQFLKTYGKNSLNDGLGAFYYVRQIQNTDIVDNDNIVALLDSTLVAVKLRDANIENINLEINNIKNEITEKPFYNMLKNGFSDGITPNDSVFANAKAQGHFKFYFPQNENKNANYYFTNIPEFNDCTILSDKDVILNWPTLNGIDYTKNSDILSNLKIYSRQQNHSFDNTQNISDYFNQFALKNYSIKHNKMYRLNASNALTAFIFNYSTNGIFNNFTPSITNYYQNNGYEIRYKTQSYYSILCTPLDITKNECIEIVGNPGTHISFGAVNSNNNHGFYSFYNGQRQGYYLVNGTANPTMTDSGVTKANIHEHYGRSNINNNYQFYIKYKLRNDTKNKKIQLFVNDIFVASYPYGDDNINYFGFGIHEAGMNSISSDNGFSDILFYEQNEIPLNTNLKILIAGDSRTYGFNQLYKIEKMIENGLKNNGINKVEINNISQSGWTLEDIYQNITQQNISNYDIVIIASGINDYNLSYTDILQKLNNSANYCAQRGAFVIVPATFPTTNEGTDTLSTERTTNYYKIQQAILAGNSYDNKNGLKQICDNVNGNTNYNNNIEMTNDGVHPTTDGSLLFAKNLVNSILSILD